MKRIEASNDFVIKFANVNGSGSASANELFAKSFLRMGIPVSPRNIFPSNIQGLPTWYEVRVTEKGHLGRRGGVDLMVAMNPQTWAEDVKEIDPGGYLFYDNTKPLPPSRFRDDIHVIGMPLTEICNATYTDSRERQLFKNILYVGALAGMMGVEPEVIAELIGEQYKGKEKLLKPNLNAFKMGLDYARNHLKDAIGLKAKRAYAVGDKIFIEGNAAAALGCLYGGATVCAWYPITPSSSLAEAFQRSCSKLRVDKDTGKNKFAIIQAEDELASIGIVVGAGWNGARAFTATAGPGISLMSEFIGLAYFAEIPAVIIDVQRGGPSTGMPNRTLPGTHPTKGAYFTRGTSKNAHAVYSEAGPDYVYNMQRLLKKFETAKTLVPKPVLTPSKEPARFGCIYYGSTSPAMHEALEALSQSGIFVNALRVRAFPFQDEIFDFVQSHSKVFVVEQNRDAQLKTLLVNDAGINPASLISVLHYDGTPITARFITGEISQIVTALNVRPIKEDKAA